MSKYTITASLSSLSFLLSLLMFIFKDSTYDPNRGSLIRLSLDMVGIFSWIVTVYVVISCGFLYFLNKTSINNFTVTDMKMKLVFLSSLFMQTISMSLFFISTFYFYNIGGVNMPMLKINYDAENRFRGQLSQSGSECLGSSLYVLNFLSESNDYANNVLGYESKYFQTWCMKEGVLLDLYTSLDKKLVDYTGALRAKKEIEIKSIEGLIPFKCTLMYSATKPECSKVADYKEKISSIRNSMHISQSDIKIVPELQDVSSYIKTNRVIEETLVSMEEVNASSPTNDQMVKEEAENLKKELVSKWKSDYKIYLAFFVIILVIIDIYIAKRFLENYSNSFQSVNNLLVYLTFTVSMLITFILLFGLLKTINCIDTCVPVIKGVNFSEFRDKIYGEIR